MDWDYKKEREYMRKLFLILALVSLASCGGGGGGSESSVNRCEPFCDYGCGKALNCLGKSQDYLPTCSNSCYDHLVANNTDDGDACSEAQATIVDWSCYQLTTALGLRSKQVRSSDAGAEVVGDEVARQIGE